MSKNNYYARKSLVVMASSCLFACLLVFTDIRETTPFWIIEAGMGIADTLFHEMGHAIFGWMFGIPAIPSILTLFGREQASGFTMTFDRIWYVQYFAFAALAFGCYWVRLYYPPLFWFAVPFTLAMIAIAFTRYYEVPPIYMGHGGAIFMGGFFLFRALKNMAARNSYERWLNAFFGFFLILHNMNFAYKLATSATYRLEYSNHTIGGAVDNDFVQLADIVSKWSVHGVASFTVGYTICALLVPIVVAYFTREVDE